MLMAPSPTADATRFTLPARTSPTANTPGRLVSSIWGERVSGQGTLCSGTAVSRSRPVRMKPLSSIATQPLGSWRRSRHDEHVLDAAGRNRSGLFVLPHHALQACVAL